MTTNSNLAEMAVELRLSQWETNELCFAVMLEAMVQQQARARLEWIAASIGLSPESAEAILFQADARVRALAQAADLLKRLIPHDHVVRALVADEPRERVG